jgi:hypothetical protein
VRQHWSVGSVQPSLLLHGWASRWAGHEVSVMAGRLSMPARISTTRLRPCRPSSSSLASSSTCSHPVAPSCVTTASGATPVAGNSSRPAPCLTPRRAPPLTGWPRRRSPPSRLPRRHAARIVAAGSRSSSKYCARKGSFLHQGAVAACSFPPGSVRRAVLPARLRGSVFLRASQARHPGHLHPSSAARGPPLPL